MNIEIPKLPYGEGSISRFEDKLMYKKTITNSSGKKKRVAVYGMTVKECFANMKQKEREFELSAKNKANSQTLSDAIQEWIDNKKRLSLKTTSSDRLVSTLNNQIRKYDIGSIRYQQITSDDIQKHIIALIEHPYSYSVIKKTYDLLNDFYRTKCLSEQFHNPMLTVEMPSQRNIIVPIKEKDFFKDDDINKFIQEAGRLKATNNTLKYQWGYALAANIYLGLRGGELIALRWKDIDFENKTINVSKRLAEVVNRKYDLSNPLEMKNKGIKRTVYEEDNVKNGKPRFVPLNSKAEELLLLHKQNCKYTSPDDFVISTRTKNHTSLKNLSDAIKLIEINAGTEVQSFNTHVLRHTCASLYFRKNIPIELIASILGHSVDVCRQTYIHIIEEQKKMAASMIAPTIQIEL